MASVLSILLTTVILAYAAHASLKFVFPQIKGILKEISKDDKTVNSVIILLSIFLILTTTSLVIDTLMTMGYSFLIYLEIFKPGINLVLSLTEPVKWILMGAVGIIAIRTFRRGS